jgi:hypothetical protein
MATRRVVELIAKLKDQMTPGLRNLAKGATVVATAISTAASAAFAATKKLADYGAEIYDTASATGVAAETIQGMGYVFEQAGGSATSFQGALRGLNTFMRLAQQGGKEQMDTLQALGLTYADLAGKEPGDVFFTLAEAVGRVDDTMQRNIYSATLFGQRYSQQVNAVLEQTGGQIRALSDEFIESGRALSTEQIDKLKEFSNVMTDVTFAVKSFLADALVPMLPVFQEGADKIEDLAQETLPKLVPALEGAVNIMIDTLPTIIDLLNTTVGGWEKLLDLMDGKVEASAQIHEMLTEAVRAGGMSAVEAQLEWEKATQVIGRHTGATEALGGAIFSIGADIDQLTTTYGILRRQQIVVSDEFNRQAIAGFYAAEGTDAATAASGRAIPILRAQAESLMGVATSLWAMLAPTGEGGSIDAPITAAGIAAGKLELTMKQILDNMKEFVKEAAEAKDLFKDRSAMQDEYLAKLQEQTAFEQEAAAARQAAIDNAKMAMADFATDMVMAAAQGTESWNAFWDNFAARMIQVTISSAFQQLLGFATGGIGGFLGGIFGFKGGGTVPGKAPYQAAGGMMVPGNPNVQGDKVPIMAEPGEPILSRSTFQDLKRAALDGGGSTVINFTYRPMISTASRAEMAKAVTIVRDVMRKGNL